MSFSTPTKRIVIASTLKPVDDTRLYEKLGRTLALTGKYVCHIIAVAGGPVDDLEVHPLAPVNRLSFARMVRPFVVLRKIFILKPDILVVSTHELLLAALAYKLFTRKAIVYDIQENYRLNILHTNVFGPVLRRVLAAWVRLKERAAAPFVDRFLLAEKGFGKELTFTRARSYVIENRAIIPKGFMRHPVTDNIELLFTGTIDESTGVYEAIALTRQLHKQDQRYCLHIIGFCARPDALEILRDMIAPFPFIRLTGGDQLQPHSTIINAISRAHFGFVLYRPSPHINNRMPTKIYEYMACRLPIIIRKDLWWCEFVMNARAGTTVDIDNVDAQHLATSLAAGAFYPSGVRNLAYEFDREALIEAFDTMSGAVVRKGETKKLSRVV